MPDPNLIPQLISRLLQLTEERKVDWRDTASDNDFQATVGQLGLPDRIADKKGVHIDEATDSSVDRDTLIAGHLPQRAFSLLYDAARRSARKVDEARTSLVVLA